jgi:uncharacterized alkaline shock family protein YloU
MYGYRRTPAAVAIVASAIITVAFVVLGLYAALHETVPFLKDLSLDAAIGTVWGKVVGGLMVLLVIVLVVALIARVRRQDCISFDNPDGELIIAISAIEDFIKRLGQSFPEVRDITPTVAAADGGVAIEARVTLWEDQNPHAVVEQVQKTVRSQVQSFFGLANVHTVKVFVARILPRAEPAAAVTVEQYPEEPVEEPDKEETDS